MNSLVNFFEYVQCVTNRHTWKSTCILTNLMENYYWPLDFPLHLTWTIKDTIGKNATYNKLYLFYLPFWAKT